MLSGAHFREFIRRGGRIPLDWIPLQWIASQSVNIALSAWEETEVLSRELIGERPDCFCWKDFSSFKPRKPEHWKPCSTVEVSLLKLTDKIVNKERLMDFFNLLSVRPSTIFEAFVAVRGWQDKSVFDKGVFVLNAQTAYSGAPDDVSIDPSWLSQKSYHEVAVCGDFEDFGNFGNHKYFMVTHC